MQAGGSGPDHVTEQGGDEARRKLLLGGNEELDRHLANARTLLIDRLLAALALFAAIVVPASMLRAFNTGWLPLYGVHALLGAITIALYLARRRLPDRFRAAALLGVFWLTGLTALLRLGLAGSGLWWLVFGSLLGSVMYSIRVGVGMMVVAVVAMSAIGAAFCTGALGPVADSSEYLRSPSAWATAIIGASLMPLLVFQAVAALNASTLDLLTQAAKQRERIRELATHDALTGVPGLMLALDRLEQSLRAMERSGAKLGLLFVDLDGFKAINDSLGHAAGNAVLSTVASRMVSKLRAGDTVARIGGDEFLVIITGAKSAEDVLCVARKMLQSVNEPIGYGRETVSARASIGAAFVDKPSLAEDVVRAADAAMYEAKRAGGQQVRLAAQGAA